MEEDIVRPGVVAVSYIETTFNSKDPRVILLLKRISDLPAESIVRLEAEAWLYTFLAHITQRRIGEIRSQSHG